MNATKLLSALFAVLLVSAGAGTAVAASSTGTPTAADSPAASDVTNETENSSNVSVSATYDNGTVTVSVSQNGSAVVNASVYANGEQVGTTDANGTVSFETNATEIEIRVVGDDFEVEKTYRVADGEFVLVEGEQTRKGPNENASTTAHGVFAVIQQWLDGGREGNLGQLIQDKLGVEKAGQKKPEVAKNASQGHGKPDAAGNSTNGDGKPDDAGNSTNGEGKPDDAGRTDDDDSDSEQSSDEQHGADGRNN